MIKFLPMPGRIYVVLDHIEDKKIGSIIIAVKQANTRKGTVTEVGEGVSVKVGDRVLLLGCPAWLLICLSWRHNTTNIGLSQRTKSWLDCRSRDGNNRIQPWKPIWGV
jgi:hypothetical protein